MSRRCTRPTDALRRSRRSAGLLTLVVGCLGASALLYWAVSESPEGGDRVVAGIAPTPLVEGAVFVPSTRRPVPAEAPAVAHDTADPAVSPAEPVPGLLSGDGREPTEHELFDAFLRAEDELPGALDAIADTVLAGDGTKAEKVALLRAVAETGSSRREALYLKAIRELPEDGSHTGVSVPSFALLDLDRRAARDAWARRALAEAAFGEPRIASAHRARAATSLFLHAPAEELTLLRDDLIAEPEGVLLESALEALGRNPNRAQADILLADHGRSRPELRDPTEP